MIYKLAIVSCKQLFQTWKNGSFINANQHTGYFTGSNHEYTLSEHTAGAHVANWLHLDTFPPVQLQYAPPLSLSPSHLEKQYCHEGNHCSGHLYFIRPWIHSFWAIEVIYSADWLHLNTLSPMEYALPQTTRLTDTWQNFHDECQQTFWSSLLDQTINLDFLSTKQ